MPLRATHGISPAGHPMNNAGLLPSARVAPFARARLVEDQPAAWMDRIYVDKGIAKAVMDKAHHFIEQLIQVEN